MYIIIVDTKEDWGHYTLITNDDGYPMEFFDYETAELWFMRSHFESYFSVKYVNMDE